MGAEQRAAAFGWLSPSPSDAPLLAVATGHFVGEGFDCPALDTLFLVHDYHDVEAPVLAAALTKRAPGYLSLGFPDPGRSG